MKKVLITLAAALVLMPLLSLSPNVTARADTYYDIYLEDIDDFFTPDQWESIYGLMRTTADTARCDLGIYVTSDLRGFDSVYDYAEDALVNHFGDNSLVMVYYKKTSDGEPAKHYSGIAASGDADKIYGNHSFELSTLVISTAMSSGDAAAVEEFCERITQYGEKSYGSSDVTEYKNSSDELLIKGDKYKAALADYDDCLTKAQEEQVLNEMEITAQKVKCNVGIVITRDLGDKKDHVDYAESFLDDNFGITSDSVVLLLLNTHNNPKYASYRDWISLSGKAEGKFQKHVYDIFDETYYALDKNGASSVTHFDSACLAFCKSVKLYSSYGFLRLSLVFVQNPMATVVSIFIGVVMALIITKCVSAKYKKKKPISASQYIDRSTVHVTFRRDDFIREYTTSVHIDNDSHGHHRSGGGGHSGGGHHGGGGGRHR